MAPLPPSWSVAADGARIESALQTRNVTTRGMTTPWFDPDGGTLRLHHAPVKSHRQPLRLFRWEKRAATGRLPECPGFRPDSPDAPVRTSRPPWASFHLANR